MKEQECSNEYVDTTNRKRLYFYAELSKMLVMFDSSDDEVNELIYKLYTLSNSLSDIEPRRKNIEYEHDTKEDKQVDENTFIRENDTHDLRIYTIIATIQEESTWAIRDALYDITDKTSINWKILKRLNHHTEEISCLTINDNLQILGTASYDCYVNIYTLIDFKLINSIQVNIIPNVLAFCSSPIPSFVVMQENLYAFAFTINGTPIDITPNMDIGIISSFCTFRDFKAKEYIVLGYSNGTIEIRRLPSLALQDMYDAKNNNSNIPPSKSNMKLAISYDAQFIIAHYNNELFIVTNVDALNHNASSNLGNLGF